MTTLVTAAQIAQLRRMVAEPTTTTYSDAILTEYIERYPHIDQYGETPVDDDGEANADWTATYDLSAAAGDVWEEKASTLAGDYDFTQQGAGSFSRSQAYEQAMKQCRYFRSKRLPSTASMVKYPKETANDSYIGNLPEPRT
jgi:hypothetical protein